MTWLHRQGIYVHAKHVTLKLRLDVHVHLHVTAQVKVSWKAYSMLDTVENGTHFPLALGHTFALSRLSCTLHCHFTLSRLSFTLHCHIVKIFSYITLSSRLSRTLHCHFTFSRLSCTLRCQDCPLYNMHYIPKNRASKNA